VSQVWTWRWYCLCSGQTGSTASDKKRETNVNLAASMAHSQGTNIDRTVFITIVGFRLLLRGPGGGQGPGCVSETPSSGCRYWGISASTDCRSPKDARHRQLNSVEEEMEALTDVDCWWVRDSRSSSQDVSMVMSTRHETRRAFVEEPGCGVTFRYL
jgi:hypothetical protein